MAARKHRHQQFLDDLLLADNHFAQLVGDAAVRLVQFLDRLDVVVVEHRGAFKRTTRNETVRYGKLFPPAFSGFAPAATLVEGNDLVVGQHKQMLASHQQIALPLRALRAMCG